MKRKSQKQIDANRVQTLLACYRTKSAAMAFISQLMSGFVGKKLIPPMVPRTTLDKLAETNRLRFEAFEREILQLHIRHTQRHAALKDAIAMVDASSFGGHKSYRCLTPLELKRLEEIRALVVPGG